MKIKLLALSILTFVTSVVFAEDIADSLSVKSKDSIFVINSAQAVDFYLEPADILNDGLLPFYKPADSIQHYIDKAHAVIQKVRELNNFIDGLDAASSFQLPVGIKKTIGGITYELAISAIRLKPAYAELDVFMQFTPPQNGTPLTFMAKGIKLSNKGGIVGDATLELVGDYAINMNGNKSQIILKGSQSNGSTFVTIDCDGFKELSVDADVKFSRDLIRPENPNGSVAAGNVIASFGTRLTSWNDLIVQLTLPTFQVTGLEGVSFSVQDAVFDFSDTRNASGVEFPVGYQSTQMLPDNQNLWRGFFMRELTVKLPQEFKRRGSTERTTFRASNVIIDNMGFTGKLSATNLITLQQGDMNNWAFSLNSLEVELQANQIVHAAFSGNIVIPIAKEDTPFNYAAIINTGGNYLFNVSPATNIEFEVFKAGKVEIYPASYLEIKRENGKFLPKASLHGRMTIQGKLSEGGQGVELADISFENLEIQTVKPYIKVGNFSFGSEALQQKMAGFPISIQDIGMRNITDTEVGLDFTLKLNLVGEDAGSFAADAALTVVGKMNSEKGWQSWKYKDIQVHEIGVDIDGGAFKFNGRLIFYKNDVSYGDGFNGTVKAEFKPGIKVSASAIFGSVNGMRYWYADAMAELPTGIPIFTGVGIYGFGGGAYYKMKIDNEGLGSRLGQTASGVVYIPDKKAGLGLKAVVKFGSHPKPEAFNGDVMFEIAFFQGGGVRYISFGGNGYMVTPGLNLNMDKLKGSLSKVADKVSAVNAAVSGATRGLLEGDMSDNSDVFGGVGEQAGKQGSLSAKVLISYDFENRVLHGNFEVFVNVAGGIIKGVGPGGRAGWAVLHFAPQEWYIYVGTPDDRIGISVGIGPIRANATSYFMVGTKILGSPPPPPEVARILGMDQKDLDYMGDLNALGTGAGFAFGAALSFTTGDLNFLMFYARFDAGAGFDIMLKDYGDTRCEGSADRIGINGWYANGQAYAYFEGAIGIRVRVFRIKKSIKILEIGAAAVLQAKLPNPFWMRGIVGGYFRVLGGLVKGQCKFEVTVGKECKLMQDPGAILDNINIIAEVTPKNGETQIDVFNTPQVLLNVPVEERFELVDESTNATRYFRIKLDYFKVIANKAEQNGNVSFNNTNDVIAFNGHDILPPRSEIKLSVQVTFEELKSGVWAKVISEGKPVTETSEQVFTTGEAPDHVPHNNVEYSYPIIGQLNFYKDETREGYIKLKKGQPYLFTDDPKWRKEGRITSHAGQRAGIFDFSYSPAEKVIVFSTPAGMEVDKIYSLQLMNVPAQVSGAIDRNVTEVTNQVIEGQSVETASKKAEGSIEDLQEESLFTSYFRTSKYETFNKKIDAFAPSNTWSWPLYNGVRELGVTFRGAEYFDKFEIGEGVNGKNLVRLEADLSETNWYQSKVFPVTYNNYPILGQAKIARSIEPLGLPPVRAMFVRQTPSDQFLTAENAVQGNSMVVMPPLTEVIYNLSLEMNRDYREIQRLCASLYLTNDTEEVRKVVFSIFPAMLTQQDYRYKIMYVLPGTDKVTTERRGELKYYVTIAR